MSVLANIKRYQFHRVEWQLAASQIMDIRLKVFVVEQRLAKEVICDAYEHRAIHLLVTEKNGPPIACGRLTEYGRLGRIAVLIGHRNCGIGTHILRRLIDIAQAEGMTNVSLNTETDLLEFYNHEHFDIDGPVYMKQGIPYQRMSLKIASR